MWHCYYGMDVSYSGWVIGLVCSVHCAASSTGIEMVKSILFIRGDYAALHKLLWWHWGDRMYCLIFCCVCQQNSLTDKNMSSVLQHCWLGSRKGIQPVKNWLVGCWSGYVSKSRCTFAFAFVCVYVGKIRIGCIFIVRCYASVVYAVILCPLSMWCGCSVPAAEWLDSSVEGIAQLAHAAGESILCHEGWWCGSFQMTLGRICFLLRTFITVMLKRQQTLCCNCCRILTDFQNSLPDRLVTSSVNL